MIIKLSQSDWESIGKQMGWMKTAQSSLPSSLKSMVESNAGNPKTSGILSEFSSAVAAVTEASKAHQDGKMGEEEYDRAVTKGISDMKALVKSMRGLSEDGVEEAGKLADRMESIMGSVL
jgi:hypothetical protein